MIKKFYKIEANCTVYLLWKNIDDLFCGPVSLLCLEYVEYIGEEGAAHVRIASSWLVQKPSKQTMLRIRDVYPGSWIRFFSVPDLGSQIRIKEF